MFLNQVLSELPAVLWAVIMVLVSCVLKLISTVKRKKKTGCKDNKKF